MFLFLSCRGATAIAATVPTAATAWSIVQTGSIEDLQTFLSTPGVDVNDRYLVLVHGVPADSGIQAADKSLLDFATDANNVAVATYLIDHGARVNEPQQIGAYAGITALHRAAVFGSADVMELLIARGANINARLSSGGFGLNGETPLFLAVSNGRSGAVEVLLHHGADATSNAIAGDTPLSEAVKRGHPEIVQLLSEYQSRRSPESLIDAARNGEVEHVRSALTTGPTQETLDTALRQTLIAGSDRPQERLDIVTLLVGRGARVNSGATDQGASTLGQASTPEIAVFLLSHGASPKSPVLRATTEVSVACNPVVDNPIGTFAMLVRQWGSISADPNATHDMLRCAVASGRIDFAEYLLRQGARSDGRDRAGRTLLFDAHSGPMVNLLIKSGVPINAVSATEGSALDAAMASGYTQAAVALANAGVISGGGASDLLHAAITRKQSSIASALISNGAEVNARDAVGRTALFWAIEADDSWITRQVIEHGADVNARDSKGWTPLHVAAQRNQRNLVSILLEKSANPALRDQDGFSPKDRATADDIRQMLLVHSRMWDDTLSPQDAAACAEVAQRADDQSLGHIVQFGEPANALRDPDDNWQFLEKIPVRIQVALNGRTYVLGSDRGPVYLSRIGDVGVERVVCEFTPHAQSSPTKYRVLGPGERLPEDLDTRPVR